MKTLKEKNRIIFYFSNTNCELFPTVYFWWKPDKGIAIGWLFWSLEFRNNKDK